MTIDASSVTLTPRQQHRLAVLNRLVAGHCTASEAAQLLGLSERTIWRLKAAYERQGAAALVHGNRDRPKSWALPEDLRDRVRTLVAERYADCNDTHITELLAREHEIFLSRPSVRRILRSGGSAAPHPRRAPRHRRRRDRYAQEGMLLQIDGSPISGSVPISRAAPCWRRSTMPPAGSWRRSSGHRKMPTAISYYCVRC
jgi:transposase